MTGAQILAVTSIPEPDHIYPPHRHHSEAIGFSYDVPVAQIQKAVPSDRLGVFVYGVVIVIGSCRSPPAVICYNAYTSFSSNI